MGKLKTKILSSILAVAMFVTMVVPTVWAADGTVNGNSTVISSSATVAGTVYHEGKRSSGAEQAGGTSVLGGNWYTNLVTGDKATVTTTTSGENKTFDIAVPIALVAGEAISDATAKSEMVGTATDAGLSTSGDLVVGFQIGTPKQISSTDVNYSNSTMTRDGSAVPDMFLFSQNTAHRGELVANTAVNNANDSAAMFILLKMLVVIH